MDGWTDRRTDGRMDEWKYEWMDDFVVGCMGRRMDEIDKLFDEWIGGQIDG